MTNTKKTLPSAAPIAVIAPYHGLADVVRAEAARQGLDVRIETGDLLEGCQLAEKLIGEGVKIFISRGGTASLIKKLGYPVVEIDVTACDILDALRARRTLSSPIGLIGFGNILASAHRLADLLAIDLRLAVVEHESEVPSLLLDMKKQGVISVLGDRVVVRQAETLKFLGFEALLIQSGPEAVAAALKEARERLALLAWVDEQNRKRLELLSQFKTVIDALEDPVMILDKEGRECLQNPAAARLWAEPAAGDGSGLKRNWARAFARVIQSGRPQTDQLTVLEGRRFLLDFRPIQAARGAAPRVAVMGRLAEKVENSERRLRKAVYLKGHVARFRFSDIITEDQTFIRLLEKAAEYAKSDSAIVIQGESGTGKEMLAQSIHNHKFEHGAPFVALNCASLPASILESELFGYAPGAFTGALREGKKGFFELAHGGTLFLDELGEMPLDLQNRLLRAIEEKAVLPLGADRLIPVEVRLIAATNVDLAEAVRQGRFRKDLYFRLGVLLLSIPPLRQRGHDPYLLFQRFAAGTAGFDSRLEWPELGEQLLQHPWPGNARELKNLVERLSITTHGFTRRLGEIESLVRDELAASRLMADPVEPPRALAGEADPRFARPLKKADLAKAMGISRSTLWRRQKRLLEHPFETK